MEKEVKDRILEGIKLNPYVCHLGIKFDVIEDGYVEARMKLRDEQKQYSGVIHGGIIASIADTVAGVAAYTKNPMGKDLLTAELNISFLRAAWGDEIKAIGRIVKPGRHIQFSECEIYCGEKLISKASGTFCVVDPQV